MAAVEEPEFERARREGALLTLDEAAERALAETKS